MCVLENKMTQPISKLALSMSPSIMTHNLRNMTTMYGLLAGASLYFAAHKEHYYIHIPLAWIAPATYAGYHAYKHKEAIIPYTLDLISKIKKL